MPDIDTQLAAAIDSLAARVAELERLSRPNQALDTTSDVTFDGLNLGSASGALSGGVSGQASGGPSVATLTSYNGSSTAVSGIRFQTARGTLGTPAASQANDWIGYVSADGYHTAGSPGFGSHSPFIRIIADENWTDTAQGVRVEFYAVADGATAASLVLALGPGAKIAFFGVTAVSRALAITQTYSTTTRTHSNLTSASLTDSTGGTPGATISNVGAAFSQATLNNNFASLTSQVNKLITDLTNVKGVLNSVIDDNQAYGLEQ